MTRGFAEAIAFQLHADVYRAEPPFVGCHLQDGSVLSFTDDSVCRMHEGAIEFIRFDDLSGSEESARRLAAWVGSWFGGESGAHEFESGWSGWATRRDGKVLELAGFGYHLYEDWPGFLAGGICEQVIRPRYRRDA